MCTKRLPTTLWGQNLDFLYGFLITKIKQNWEFWSFFAIFSKSVWCQTLKLGYRHILDTFKSVWKKTPAGQICGPFLAPNRAEICQYVGFRLFSWKFSAGITGNLIYYHVRAIICRCVCSKFCNWFFITKIGQNGQFSRFFAIFSKCF